MGGAVKKDLLTALQVAELRKLWEAAKVRGCDRWVVSPHDKELAQVYSPQTRSLLRKILPVAETTIEDGTLIAAMYNVFPLLLDGMERLLALESALEYVDAHSNEKLPEELNLDGSSNRVEYDKFADAVFATAKALGWKYVRSKDD